MTITTLRAAGGAARAVLAATILAIAAPAIGAEGIPAETLSPANQASILVPTYLDCGEYYTFVSACVADQKSYLAIGDALWKRGKDIAKAGGITQEAMRDRVFSLRDEWIKDTGYNCAKMENIHKQYKGFCEGIYQGLQSDGK